MQILRLFEDVGEVIIIRKYLMGSLASTRFQPQYVTVALSLDTSSNVIHFLPSFDPWNKKLPITWSFEPREPWANPIEVIDAEHEEPKSTPIQIAFPWGASAERTCGFNYSECIAWVRRGYIPKHCCRTKWCRLPSLRRKARYKIQRCTQLLCRILSGMQPAHQLAEWHYAFHLLGPRPPFWVLAVKIYQRWLITARLNVFFDCKAQSMKGIQSSENCIWHRYSDVLSNHNASGWCELAASIRRLTLF